MKVVVKKQKLDRVTLENPFVHKKYEQRLREYNAVDLRDNCQVEDLKNGYSRATPIDKSKVFC